MDTHTLKHALLAGTGGFIAILLLAGVSEFGTTALIMAPFGASCVLLFALPEAALSQPRNVIGGHLLTASVGLAFYSLAPNTALFAALAVGLTISLMVLTKTTHPPAGANPLLFFLAAKPLGAWFLLTPVASGAILLVLLATLYHRATGKFSYPVKR
ncbi:HPP family protein [Iodobacter sp. LRB]|uniref:HPP family protein n=1 Tax=unclassified Iodobacter TaxID=235634 RepID=UPI000C0FB738|nr:HPP family protein [Iodobacter sp. BJB302]PHV03272.1 HPP family protein [Iodobacter sp. BJB302]